MLATTNNNVPKQHSMFEAIAEKIKPANIPYHIVSLSFETTIDKIVVTLGITWHANSTEPTKTEIIVIEHDDFQTWCDANEKLIEIFGEIDDPREYPLSYTEFMMDHVQRSDLKEYIIEKNLIQNHSWSI